MALAFRFNYLIYLLFANPPLKEKRTTLSPLPPGNILL